MNHKTLALIDKITIAGKNIYKDFQGNNFIDVTLRYCFKPESDSIYDWNQAGLEVITQAKESCSSILRLENVIKNYFDTATNEEIDADMKKAEFEEYNKIGNFIISPSKVRAEKIISYLEERGFLDFDGGEQEERKGILEDIEKFIEEKL